jgi:septation ring formation regulator EzrA
MNYKNYKSNTFQDLLNLIKKQNKMATKKKTAAAKPKTYTLTEEQFQQLQEVATEITSIRHGLSNLDDEDVLPKIMFNIGKLFVEVNNCEYKLDNILGEFDDDSDDLSW